MTFINMISGRLQTSLFILFFGLMSSTLDAQAIAVNSANGYLVHISLTPTTIVAPNSCDWGYNFNVGLNYNVTFSGHNIPAEGLYTLQGYMTCGSLDAGYFPLPRQGGSGTITTNGNPWNPRQDCGSATVNSLQCNRMELVISGPGIPQQTLIYSAVLPVELISFDAVENKGGVSLVWETGSERDNAYFVVERSQDNQKWETVQQVNGAGNSNSFQKYSAVDTKPYSGISYYRLQQVDFNGAASYSDVQAVNIKTESNEAVNIFPNPVFNTLTIEGNDLDPASVQIFSLIGRDVTSSVAVTSANSHGILLDCSTLAAGIYWVKVGDKTVKVVKG